MIMNDHVQTVSHSYSVPLVAAEALKHEPTFPASAEAVRFVLPVDVLAIPLIARYCCCVHRSVFWWAYSSKA